jgi:hypothetical protein
MPSLCLIHTSPSATRSPLMRIWYDLGRSSECVRTRTLGAITPNSIAMRRRTCFKRSTNSPLSSESAKRARSSPTSSTIGSVCSAEAGISVPPRDSGADIRSPVGGATTRALSSTSAARIPASTAAGVASFASASEIALSNSAHTCCSRSGAGESSHGAQSASIVPSVRPPTPSYPTRRASNERNIRPRRPD